LESSALQQSNLKKRQVSVARHGITRRGFLGSAAATGAVLGGGWLATRHYLTQPSVQLPDLIPGEPLALTADGKLLDTAYPDPFAGGEYLGHLPFLHEAEEVRGLNPGVRLGKGHNARRIIDPATLLTPQGRLTPGDEFYIRTEYPDQLRAPLDWTIKIHGEVKQSKDVSLKQLPNDRSKRPVLLECTDNAREMRFGLVSVGEWTGIPIQEIIKLAQPTSKAKAILINGFDEDSRLPRKKPPFDTHSWPTCSWIYTFDQLVEAGAFLATELNGAPLPKDQGGPVRLVVPGWYGCAEPKWVDEVKFVDDDQPATLQMQEFASRTFQKLHVDEENPRPPGMGPAKARDYQPATIDPVALPVRVEAWKLDDKLAYRVIGTTWGGPKRTDKLLIRFVHGNAPKFEPVQFCQTQTSIPEYGIWCHRWQPKRRGIYWIEMRLGDPKIRTRKMWMFEPIGINRSVTYHARAVDIRVV
jgi:DMSO/TMAO reductase YedYZ molybdopterin-dependent catalytic subunit